jgi:anti-anti-sigma factor
MEEQMEINVTQTNARVPVTVLRVSGNLDSATYEPFQSKSMELISGGARYFLIDLAQVSYISSAGLRALQAIFNKLRSVNGDVSEKEMRQQITVGTYKSPHLKLLNLSKAARAAFEMAGFDMFIATYTDEKTAVASF